MSGLIHSTAVIHPQAELADDVRVGPFCVVGANVKIEQGCQLDAHVVIEGHSHIGPNNRFFPFSCIGAEPQDKKYRNEPTELRIGTDNTFRENVTVNTGTVQDLGYTAIGDHNWIMAGVHIAHDCIVGNNTIFANAVALAGHVKVDDWAILGGYTLVHQFCHIGAHAFCGMGSVINQDVPNYVVVSGNIAKPHGINSEGLKRRDFDEAQISLIKKAYRILYRKEFKLNDAIIEIQALNDHRGTLDSLVAFLSQDHHSGIIR
ncbi:acyl-ACP--UDP-N-acetylglucosamine O-acyltransferase [Thiomicrospira sp. ALE5]|uniref:acyl-ACP--UDP-N-acetylglucosamine O-acyltransferase n=1 Tax=Thiomicrospira sp. ALE5 TaxID=748650 RepID=UPI0008EBA5EF|nr:acyl-ACP--UDP-N-acetylglucosamine O-acyltransferase [Thiomicrospira sp. ALE5]SFR48985.1 acyl-[acyl-carrier-protein]--UDP-N-acetylglucosamine O-acyltransferase [Thiomicrospira sp. ALE5]